jgi:hypothetical protein
MEQSPMLMDWKSQHCENGKLPKAILIITILIKIPMTFCTKIKTLILKYLWKHKRPKITKAVLSKKSCARDITISNSKLY